MMTDNFRLNKLKIKQSFSNAALTYDSVTQLQRQVGQKLMRHVNPTHTADTLLDLGCGTGFLTAELLSALSCGQLIAVDMALPMLQATRDKLGLNGHLAYVCADAERLPVATGVADGVFSNLMLQWCVDLPIVFGEIYRILKPGGRLVFSIFGSSTLKELKQAWASVDSYSHVNNFYDYQALLLMLRQSGLNVLEVGRDYYVSNYGSVWTLMKELKAIGAHNVTEGRNRQLTGKTRMQHMMAAYPNQGVAGSVSATYEVVTVVANR